MNPALQTFVRLARPVPAQELDLQVVERVHVREAVADRATQELVIGQEVFLLFDGQQVLPRPLELAADGRKDFLAQSHIGHEFGITRGDAQIGLGHHHIHVR